MSTQLNRKELLKTILNQFRISKQGVHGPAHWARVRYHALMIGKNCGADLSVVELFAFLHDSQRINEFTDPEHGARAAEFARSLNGAFFSLDTNQLELLCTAISGHSGGEIHADPTIQTCWDADRLDLGRVGIKPDPEFLSLLAVEHIESAYQWSIQNSSEADFGLD
jgi:uncharacterized protein